jgi:hypothetical protein
MDNNRAEADFKLSLLSRNHRGRSCQANCHCDSPLGFRLERGLRENRPDVVKNVEMKILAQLENSNSKFNLVLVCGSYFVVVCGLYRML